jgi:hypothetical protein
MALFFRLLGFVFLGISMMFLNLAYLAMTTFMRLLPGLLFFLRFLLQGFLRLSYRCYRQILRLVSPAIYQHFGIDTFTIPARTTLSLLFSLIVGVIILLSANMSMVWWIMGLSSAHGLVVGLRWDQLEPPGGLQLGVKT